MTKRVKAGTWLPLLGCLLGLLWACVLGACDEPPPSGDSCESSADCEAGEVCIDGRCEVGTDASMMRDAGGEVDASDPPARLVSVAIEPASATLTAAEGETPEQVFRLVGTYSNGMMGPVSGGSFSIDPTSLGFIDEANGRFIANGVIGGSATVTGSVPNPAGGPDLVATATLEVRLTRQILVGDVPDTAPATFAGATPVVDPSRAATIAYPLDGVIMPQNVFPADVQWLNGSPGDVVHVRVRKPHITIDAYLTEDGNHHWLFEAAAWRALAQTDGDEAATIEVERLEAATSEVIGSPSISMRFARAAITGSVYYWDISVQRIIRINDGTGVAEEFMPNPPAVPGGQNCVGCHSISNSGRYMAGRIGPGQNYGTVFDLTRDLTGSPAPQEWPFSSQWWFSSWSPDDTRIVAVTFDDRASRQLFFMDPLTGATVPITGTLPGGTHPSWSPDGSQIAYVANNNTWGGQNTTGDIAIIDVTGPDTVGGNRVIHPGADLAGSTPMGTADSYPTWSPDSRFLAFAHGTGSRSETMLSALYMMRRDGSEVVRLDQACGGTDTSNNFQPNFSPFEAGGYYWLSFLSRRDYGNAQVGTRGRDYQQIWVTAIRTDAAPGEDPSAVSYWLPGQRVTARNISAFWAPRACRPDGESCSVGSECCGGDCLPGPDGALVCSPPPPERCREEGETCTTDADCCDGGPALTCFGNVCAASPI